MNIIIFIVGTVFGIWIGGCVVFFWIAAVEGWIGGHNEF